MFTMSAHLADFLNAAELLRLCGLEPGGRVQHAINQAIGDGCDNGQYLPKSPDGTLSKSFVMFDDEGLVAWNTPYARYLYYGFVMTDENGRTWVSAGEKKPIIHEDWQLEFDTAQSMMAGPHWFERFIADHKQDVLDAAAAAMSKGGR